MNFISEKDFDISPVEFNLFENSEERALKGAQDLLYMPSEGDYNYEGVPMSGYTPTAAGYFKDVGEYDQTPHVGDVVYFNDASGIAHVGIVSELTDNGFKTVEGNTSGDVEFEANGGAVAEKEYTMDQIGGRVDGFGHPNFESAGITPEQFVETAKSYVGYLEKDSLDCDLEDFTDDAGYNNFQKFEQEINNTNGSYWCQYFVDYVAKETVQNNTKTIFETIAEGVPEPIMDPDEQEENNKNINQLIENAKDPDKDAKYIFDGVDVTKLKQEISEENGDPDIIETSDLEKLKKYLSENSDLSTNELFDASKFEEFGVKENEKTIDNLIEDNTIDEPIIEPASGIIVDRNIL